MAAVFSLEIHGIELKTPRVSFKIVVTIAVGKDMSVQWDTCTLMSKSMSHSTMAA